MSDRRWHYHNAAHQGRRIVGRVAGGFLESGQNFGMSQRRSGLNLLTTFLCGKPYQHAIFEIHSLQRQGLSRIFRLIAAGFFYCAVAGSDADKGRIRADNLRMVSNRRGFTDGWNKIRR